jgi:hypothetical protein
MSRHSPTGFVFSLVVEIAAVVAIVSFLPRIDLRPAAAAAAASNFQAGGAPPAQAEPTISHVGWTTPDSRETARPSAETSYYQRHSPQPLAAESSAASQPQREPPPLIVADPSTPGYVEQRLDRASQQLVNSVGTAVANTAGNWLNYPPQPTTAGSTFAAPAASPQPSFSTQATPSAARRPATAANAAQPRPWMRY